MKPWATSSSFSPPLAAATCWSSYAGSLCFHMLAGLFFHGFLLVFLTGLFNRWLDDDTTADICFLALLGELSGAVVLVKYMTATDSMFFTDLGAIQFSASSLRVRLLIGYDQLSAFFFGILAFALLVCFFFLVEYFEYDSSAGLVIWLSAAFSQVALLYFCAFDLMLMVLAWELISLISFFLVQHWAFRLVTLKAGLKVFAYSQCGDFPLFLFFFLIASRVETTDVFEILGMSITWFSDYILCGAVLLHYPSLLAFFLYFAVFLKAAQFIFYPWLLDAMEAPVPISAQLHSSTLVIIGFYLIFRFHTIFAWTHGLNTVVVCVGFITVVGASVLGFMQTDGKRLLACSTASQLGYVVVAMGVQLYEEALLLLAFCCCNKAVTFVWFGTLMRRFAGLSDLRFIGGWANLTLLEQAGLTISILNFTVWPGVFSWHVKSVFLQGYGDGFSVPLQLGFELLQLTWFFSSLYLWALFIGLFMQTLRGQGVFKYVQLYRGLFYSRDVTVLSSALTFILLIASLSLTGYGIFSLLAWADVSWLVSTLTIAWSYY